jgi:hypothetical protein
MLARTVSFCGTPEFMATTAWHHSVSRAPGTLS